MPTIDPILNLRIKHFYWIKAKVLEEKAKERTKARIDGTTLNVGRHHGTIRTTIGTIKARGEVKAKAKPSMIEAKGPIHGSSGATSIRSTGTRRTGALKTRSEREVDLCQPLASGVQLAIDPDIPLIPAMPALSNHHPQGKEKLDRARKDKLGRARKEITVLDMATGTGRARIFPLNIALIKQLLHCTTNLHRTHHKDNRKTGGRPPS